jgi:hypothetical protein
MTVLTPVRPVVAAAARRIPRPAEKATFGGTRRGSVERFALVAMVLALALQPALHPTGPGNSSPVDLFTLVSLIAAAMWAAAERIRMRAPYVLAAALMILGGTLAGINGPLPGMSLLGVIQDIVLIAWCTAIGVLARVPGRLLLLARAWAYGATASASILILGYFAHVTAITGIVAREGNRVLFTFGDPNYAATYWVLSIFIVHACQTPRRLGLRLCAYGLLVWALFLSESNGGMVELGIGVGVLVLLRMVRRYGVVTALALALAVGATVATTLHFFPLSSIQTWARGSGQSFLVNSLGRSNASSAQRSILITEAWQLYESDGWLGSGAGSTKPLLQSRSYEYAKMAHDDYLAALVERGPLGEIGLIVLLGSVGWRGRQVLRGALRPPENSTLPKPAGLVAAMLAVAAAASYYQVLHFRFVWALFAFIAAYAWTHADAVTHRSGGR